jgi:hypothetical protein
MLHDVAYAYLLDMLQPKLATYMGILILLYSYLILTMHTITSMCVVARWLNE